MAVVSLTDASFASFLAKPTSAFGTDLSHASTIEVISTYERFKRKANPKYTLSPEKHSIELIQQQFGIVLQPGQINDEFWMHYIMFMEINGVKGSTIKTYCSAIITALKWGSRFNLSLSATYDCYDRGLCKYERTKAVLTADDVSLIAHFDIMNIPCVLPDYHESATKQVAPKWEKRVEKVNAKYKSIVVKINEKYITDEAKIKDMPIGSKSQRTKLKKLSEEYKSKLEKAKKVLLLIDDEHKEQIIKSEEDRIIAHAIYEHKNHMATLCRVRDQFVLQCNLGQRYSDIRRIDPSCFSEDKNTYTCVQQKTGNKAVVNIKKFGYDRNVVRDILERYNYYAPYPCDISNYNKHLHELLKLIGGRFNETVKTENKVRGKVVVEEVPKWQAIASHTGRRSFVSKNVKQGQIEAEIRRCTGHKDSKSFVKYIVYNEEDN